MTTRQDSASLSLFFAGMLLALTACEKPEAQVLEPVQKVSTMQIERVEVSERYRLTGEIAARQITGYSFPSSGRVLEVKVDTGDTVAAGDVMAIIDAKGLQAFVDSARAVLYAKESQRKLAATQYERQQSLMQQGFSTRSALDAANTVLISARSAVTAGKARLNNAEDALAKAVLTAESDGVVLSRFVEPGQIVQTGQSIVSVAASVRRDAIFDVPEAVFFKEFPDTTIQLSLVDQPNVTATGTVREVSPLIDPLEGTVRVTLSVNGEDELLPIGAAVRGTAQTRVTQEFSLPWTALDAIGKRPAVWVIDPATGKVHQQPVRVTRYESDEVIIDDGLDDGDWIVATGRQFVMSSKRLSVNGESVKSVGKNATAESVETAEDEGVKVQNTGADTEDQPARPILWMAASAASAAYSTVPGTIMAREENEVGFTLSGRLVSREVSVGDSVQQGERLAAIDAVPFELAQLAAEADLSAARNRYQNAVAEEARYAELVQVDATTRVDFDNARNAREAAEAAVEQANASLASANDQLDNTIVRADFDGVITKTSLEVGELALPGATVLALANPAVREAVIDLPAQRASGLQPDAPITIALELAPDIVAQGRVRLVSPDADAATRLFRVRIELDRPDVSFHLGSTIIASIPLELAPGIRLPASAVSEEKGSPHVWRYDRESGTVSPLPVEVSATDAGFVIVRVEIAAEAIIVAAGVNHLKDGQPVSLGEELRFD